MDRPLSDSTIGDFLDGVEQKAKGEDRTEYVMWVDGTLIMPETGEPPAEVLPERTEAVIVSMLSEQWMYDAI